MAALGRWRKEKKRKKKERKRRKEKRTGNNQRADSADEWDFGFEDIVRSIDGIGCV